jgi:hypothetical protein
MNSLNVTIYPLYMLDGALFRDARQDALLWLTAARGVGCNK